MKCIAIFLGHFINVCQPWFAYLQLPIQPHFGLQSMQFIISPFFQEKAPFHIFNYMPVLQIYLHLLHFAEFRHFIIYCLKVPNQHFRKSRAEER